MGELALPRAGTVCPWQQEGGREYGFRDVDRSVVVVMGGSCGHSLLSASIFFPIEIRSKTHQSEIGEAVLEL